jgi:hypothetical protein
MILLKDIEAVEKGACFLNVDLHIHSYGASCDVQDATMTPQAIVDSALAQGLSVIAITDHNSNKNVDGVLEYAERYAGNLLVLPGVEVTTAHGHLLAYFAPERTGDLDKFLSRVDLIGEKGGENTRTAKSMADVIAEAERLGGICIAAHIDREKTGFDLFAPGFQNWKRDVITSAGLYGVECDNKDNLCWYSEADEPGSAGAERRKLFEARALASALEGRHDLAHVQGSDSHSMSKFQNDSPDKVWTRVKLNELSFSALRTALIDPSARVRAIPRVRGMSVTGGFLHGEVFQFSDNLNCIIGGRGTGKSTAIRALAYAFGINEEFGGFENCPDSVVVYCEDADGVLYRYERSRGGDISVKAKEVGSITDVPTDIFRIEYFGQGKLAEVAKDPLNAPQLLQEFLDRHINLRDLLESEESLVKQMRENAARLIPLESSFSQLAGKRQSLADVEKKLKIAEEGKLRDVVGVQSKITSEKTIRASVETIIQEYKRGLTLAKFERDYAQLTTTAGDCTSDPISKRVLQTIHEVLDATNANLKLKATEINVILGECAKTLAKHCVEIKTNHARLDGEMATKVADLRTKGLAGNIAELQQLLRQKESVGREITLVEQRRSELEQCREQRNILLADLTQARANMAKRRKAQLRNINQNLSTTIKDYTVFVRYDDTGITDEFREFMEDKMTGSYLQDQTIGQVCDRITPCDLAIWVLGRENARIASTAGISLDWAEQVVKRLSYWNFLFELQVLAKPPKPIITVRTRSTPPKDIPVCQLSDGQRHTILLTIAMLAESNVPLVIDQPEDDLDNAFIFSSIVATLRAIKERRQVILVTHNANIAVLGDSELLLPMHRENDCGKATERGSIDREGTKQSVQDILEGGRAAFLRRKEIYGY